MFDYYLLLQYQSTLYYDNSLQKFSGKKNKTLQLRVILYVIDLDCTWITTFHFKSSIVPTHL